VTDQPLPPPKPHPIDVALAALSEYAAEVLAGDRPSRFAELQVLTHVAQAVQRLKPPEAAGVADMGLGDGEDGFAVNAGFDFNVEAPVMRRRPVAARGHRWNDAADINTQMMMLAQRFLQQYVDAEKAKASKPDPDVRLNEVRELSELFLLRLNIATSGGEALPEINSRIDHLLKRIGEPPHEPARPEPEPDPVVSPHPVRRHQADGAGEPDGGRVGEPLAE
jgi:hypothetical protein